MGRRENISILSSRCFICFSSFYTGKHKIVDTGGRVDRFKKRFAKTTSAVKSEANDSSEEETVEAQEEVTETPVEEVQDDISEAPTEEAAQEETSKDKE